MIESVGKGSAGGNEGAHCCSAKYLAAVCALAPCGTNLQLLSLIVYGCGLYSCLKERMPFHLSRRSRSCLTVDKMYSHFSFLRLRFMRPLMSAIS